MSKAPGVLESPGRGNKPIDIPTICMFTPSGDCWIDFALLDGQHTSWEFYNVDERDSALNSIYDQLGVIE